MSLLRELIGALVMVSAALASIYWIASRKLTTTDPFEVRQSHVVGLDWSADGRTLLSRSRGTENFGSSLCLHTVGDAPASRPLPMGGDSVRNAALLPDVSAVLLLGNSGVLWRLDLRSHEEIDLAEIPAPFDTTPLAVSADGAVFAVAVSFDVLLCDSRSGRQLLRLTGHASHVNDVIISADGEMLVTAGDDGTIRLWNVAARTLVRTIDFGKLDEAGR